MNNVTIVKQIVKPVFTGFNLPKEIQKDSVRFYSPGFKDGGVVVHTGLTFDEQFELLPVLIGVSSTSSEFQSKVDEYFSNYSYRIPYDGIEIDASYRQVGDKKIPVNIPDYILSKLMFNDSNVCVTADKDNLHFYKFVLIDKEAEKKVEEEMFAEKRKANIEYVKLIESKEDDKLKYILTIMRKEADVTAIEVDDLTRIQLEQKLSIISTKSPDKFVKLVSDDKLLTKAMLATAIDLNVVSKIGESFFFDEDKIADTYSQLVGAVIKDNNLTAKITAKVGAVKKELKS
jgi:hypothetical protein